MIGAQATQEQGSSSSADLSDETPDPDGDFFGAYNADEMPWPSSTPMPRATHLDVDDDGDVDDDRDVLMDGSGGHCSSVADSQGTGDEDEGGEDDSYNEEVITVHEEGLEGEGGLGIDISKDCVRIATLVLTFLVVTDLRSKQI